MPCYICYNFIIQRTFILIIQTTLPLEKRLVMKNGILVVSFGTTYKEARKLSLEQIENTISSAYRNFSVYKAYTSKIVQKCIHENEGFFVPDVNQALQKISEDGIDNIYIQPTHIIPGEEYNKILDAAGKYKDKFNIIKTAMPLLSSDKDFELTADILNHQYGFDNTSSDSAIILMGHGSGHSANKCYSQFQYTLNQKGFSNVFVSTVEGFPDFDSTLNILKEHSYKNITLIPFMVTAGDHAHNDMAGNKENSWKNRLYNLGYNVIVITQGLGGIPEIQSLYLSHLENIIG